MAKDKYDIFLSYIRDDSGGWTNSLYLSLLDKLSPGKRVFKDDVETEAGEKWAPRLTRLVKNCEFFLLVITPEWSGNEIRQRLENDQNWVRKEILTALKSGKTIIPLLMNGAGMPSDLPDELKPAINEPQSFSFSKGSDKWNFELEKLCKRLTNTAISNGNRVTMTRHFAALDRVREASCVRDIAKRGIQVVTVCANIEDSPLVFAQRCGLELDGQANESGSFKEAIELDWMEFVENISESLRRQDLLLAIAASCGVETIKDSLEQRLKQHFKKNQETLLFHCAIPNVKRALPERMNEWLSIWEDLLQECPATNTLVILFYPRASLFILTRRPQLSPEAGKSEQRLHRHGLGKIQLDHAKTFIHKLTSKGYLDQDRQNQMQQESTKIFYFTFGRRFRSVMESLDPYLRG